MRLLSTFGHSVNTNADRTGRIATSSLAPLYCDYIRVKRCEYPNTGAQKCANFYIFTDFLLAPFDKAWGTNKIGTHFTQLGEISNKRRCNDSRILHFRVTQGRIKAVFAVGANSLAVPAAYLCRLQRFFFGPGLKRLQSASPALGDIARSSLL